MIPHRSSRATSALLLAALLWAQPMGSALHFLVVEHGAVTAEGTAGHSNGHEHSHQCGHVHVDLDGPFVASPAPDVEACTAFETFLRAEEVDLVDNPNPVSGVPPVVDNHLPGSSCCPHTRAALSLAPKQSPPIV